MFTKTQFVEALKEAMPEALPSKASAEKMYDAFSEILFEGISSGAGVRIPDVGTFSIKDRPARTGRNPQTGASIEIPAKKVIKFTTAKALSEALNKQQTLTT